MYEESNLSFIRRFLPRLHEISFSKKKKRKKEKKEEDKKEDCMKSWTKVLDLNRLSIYDHMLHYNVFS